ASGQAPSAGRFILQLVLFVGAYLAATAALERELLTEAVGYLRRRSNSPAPVENTPMPAS
ncbi:MAG: hypothetical protein NTX07_01625, partial [Solirubrobacterales bacterium]|nr:hypothetical protein [Solirubrobacterales bacterium]